MSGKANLRQAIGNVSIKPKKRKSSRETREAFLGYTQKTGNMYHCICNKETNHSGYAEPLLYIRLNAGTQGSNTFCLHASCVQKFLDSDEKAIDHNSGHITSIKKRTTGRSVCPICHERHDRDGVEIYFTERKRSCRIHEDCLRKKLAEKEIRPCKSPERFVVYSLLHDLHTEDSVIEALEEQGHDVEKTIKKAKQIFQSTARVDEAFKRFFNKHSDPAESVALIERHLIYDEDGSEIHRWGARNPLSDYRSEDFSLAEIYQLKATGAGWNDTKRLAGLLSVGHSNFKSFRLAIDMGYTTPVSWRHWCGPDGMYADFKFPADLVIDLEWLELAKILSQPTADEHIRDNLEHMLTSEHKLLQLFGLQYAKICEQ